MKFKNFTLDQFQEEAIKAIDNNYSVVVSAPTGSGKTLIADYIIDKNKNNNKKIIYTAPIKALSNQKYKDFSKEYGERNVGLMTGDIVINPTAKILIMTTEIYRNMVVGGAEDLKDLTYVIFDEIHFINDIERGYVWEESIIYSSETVRFLCLSATIPNSTEFSNWISAIKRHEVKTVIAEKRNVPLEFKYYDYELGLTTLEKIKSAREVPNYNKIYRKMGKGRHERIPPPNHIELIKELGEEKMPCFFFHFSRHACQERAQELAKKNMFKKNPAISSFIAQKLKEAPEEIGRLTSTRILKETLPQGIAFHHAGLLPVLKETIEELFSQGLIKVLYVTETFAVGINMPAKTVCFDSLRKYDGVNFRNLNSKEFFQIAGRAGRRGIDKIGYVVVMIYRPTFRYNEVKSIVSKDMEPIRSQFKLSVNTVLNLINRHSEEEIEHILRMSFYSYQKFGEKYDQIPAKVLLSRYNSVVKKLKKYNYIQEGKLTPKGFFSARIFADEITLGEIFATDFIDFIDEYQILLLIAAVVYEPKEMDQFKQEFKNEALRRLWKLIPINEVLAREKKFNLLNKVTTFINPIYNGKTFFDVMKLTNLLEGDLIRVYAQILDRLGQIRKATVEDKVIKKIENCEDIIKKSLEGIYLL